MTGHIQRKTLAAPGSTGDKQRRVGVRRLAAITGLLLAILVGTAAPASAVDLVPDDLVPDIGCNKPDPPMPASPSGDVPWIMQNTLAGLIAGTDPSVAPAGKDALNPSDPFTDPDVSFATTYGVTPQWFSYDAGCMDGIMASVGSGLGNLGLIFSGTMINWTQALFDAVIAPGSWIGTMDKPVSQATDAVANGVWTPWLTLVLLLVAVLVMVRARHGKLSGSVTATVWALLVLVVVSWLIKYPTEATDMVDTGVQTAVTGIADGFNQADEQAWLEENCSVPKDCGLEDRPDIDNDSAAALRAIDGRLDSVVRSTQYRTWLAGVFGDADSSTAKKYGPRVFRASHWTWHEYAQYQRDPGGQGKKLLGLKQQDFVKVAQEIKAEDPRAYSYFTGTHWGQRLGLAGMNFFVVFVVCGFLLVAALAILLAYVLIRLLVPFAPAAGVLFMLDTFRDTALSLGQKVAGPLVMGPVYFLVGLLLVRYESVVLTSQMAFAWKLGIITVMSWLAWKLTRPAAGIPGIARLRRAVTRVFTTYLGSKHGTQDALKATGGPTPSEAPPENQPVVKPNDGQKLPAELSSSRPAPTALPAGTADSGNEVEVYEAPKDNNYDGDQPWAPRQARTVGSSKITADRAVSGKHTPLTAASTEATEDQNNHELGRHRSAQAAQGWALDEQETGDRSRRDWTIAEEDMVAGGAPASGGPAEPADTAVAEANVTHDSDGTPIFELYHPDGEIHEPVSDPRTGPVTTRARGSEEA